MTKSGYIQRVLLIMNEAGMFDAEGAMFSGADSAQIDRYIEGSYPDAWRRCAAVLPKAWLGKASFKNYPLIMRSNGTGYVILPNDFYLLNNFKMAGWNKSVYDAYVDNDRISSIQSNEFTRGSQLRPVAVLGTKEFDVITLTSMTTAPATAAPGNTYYNATDKLMHTYTNGAWDAGTKPHFGVIYVFNGKRYLWNMSPLASDLKIDITDPIQTVLNYYSLPKCYETHTIQEAIYIPTIKPLIDCAPDEELNIDPRIVEPLAYLNASTVFTLFEKYNISKALEEKVVQMFPGFRSVKGKTVSTAQ